MDDRVLSTVNLSSVCATSLSNDMILGRCCVTLEDALYSILHVLSGGKAALSEASLSSALEVRTPSLLE